MAEQTGATGGRSFTWLWMLLAVVVVAGFLTWLGMASEPSAVAIVEEDTTEVDAEDGTFTEVPRDSLAADKARYAGQVIRVPDLQATGGLGPQVFWGELGTPERQVPILVRLDSALAADSVEVESGDRYAVTGLVQSMTDSVAAAWLEGGVLPDEGAEMQATFADYFIEASRIRPARSGGAGDGSQGADDAGDGA
ncbi:MAG TPA: hypothetical protein VK966_11130 [Longimicrobiales bacterium]|nr:hypothetical protein [Longimicrobiales bacterium]